MRQLTKDNGSSEVQIKALTRMLENSEAKEKAEEVIGDHVKRLDKLKEDSRKLEEQKKEHESSTCCVS